MAVEVDRSGRPANRLVTIGDSLTQGFMSGAIFRTDLSWPAIVAHELGLRAGDGFRYPVYEPPTGPGGLPLDIERALRGLEARVGDRVDWHEAVRALRFARSYLDTVEDWWERGPGTVVPPTRAPYHNLAVYGADLLDVLLLDADRIARRLAKPPRDDAIAQIVDRDNDRAWRVVLESCRAPGGASGTVLDAAQVNLDYTNIISPVDGTVVSRNVTMGQTVAASFQTPTLFLIATDLTKMQVDANVSESDIGGIRNGNKATFTVDAYSRRAFEGRVTQVRQSPQTVQNVVTYDVVVSVDNSDRRSSRA